MRELSVGSPAPDFTLNDKDGTAITLSAVPGEYKVVYFYPKDDTPGCTIEAKEFSAAMDVLTAQGVSVVGISGGTDRTKQTFCRKYGLTVPLVSDSDFSVCKRYGAYGTKSFMGRTFDGILRKTFVVGPDGRIVKIFHTVKPEGHAKEVLEVIRKLQAGEPVDVESSRPAKAASSKKGASKKVTARKKAVAKVAKKTTSVKSKAAKTAGKAATKATSKKAAKKAGARKVVKKKPAKKK